MIKTRTEKDSMGSMQVPASALYGATTERARLNFPISNLRFSRYFIKSLGLIKLACAEVNSELMVLDTKLCDAIINAASRVANGEFDQHFVIDIFQTGSGTSTNMNANEVIANLAITNLGGNLGERATVHPNDHVNKGQSSNDVIPSAIHLAACICIKDVLLPAMQELEQALLYKSKEFWGIVKTGRTHLQDATPIRLGQEFLGYSGQVRYSINRCNYALGELRYLALGGTAVGTGIGAHLEFADKVINRLAILTGIPLRKTSNHFQAQSTIDNIVIASGILRGFAISLLKIVNDIRWMGSGPRAGINEIELPEVQPGSSIMPGKVNPVIAESVAMVCAQVIGNDTTITIAGQSGNFELNVMLPIAAHNLLESIILLANSCRNLSVRCVEGIKATNRGPSLVEQGLAICTALAPIIGYDSAANIAKEAASSGKTVKEIARQQTNLSDNELSKALDPLSMV